MIFFACTNYNGTNPETYNGIQVTTLGDPNIVVATFNSYDPLYDYQNFISWTESIGDENVGFCDSLKHFAKDYKTVSNHDAALMLSMVYGDHQDCENG
ncbi:hypothetical protein [Bacillus sp. T3]|uniref:hypothetical protein n=1 Tax=Bacillus sp. T3 TaxID=467262 RepID=UPI002982938B|nr:hypothetical protein [Bacillus sp. T3]